MNASALFSTTEAGIFAYVLPRGEKMNTSIFQSLEQLRQYNVQSFCIIMFYMDNASTQSGKMHQRNMRSASTQYGKMHQRSMKSASTQYGKVHQRNMENASTQYGKCINAIMHQRNMKSAPTQ